MQRTDHGSSKLTSGRRSPGSYQPLAGVCVLAASLLLAGLPVDAESHVAEATRSRTVPAVAPPAWSVAEPISPVGAATQDQPAVVIDSAGTTTAAWVGTDDSFFEPRGVVVRRKLAGAVWGPEQLVDPEAASVELEVDADDHVTPAYAPTQGPRRAVPTAVTADAAGVFGEPVQLSSAVRLASSVKLAVAPNGSATAAWIPRLPDRIFRVAVAHRPAAGDWQPATYLSPASTRARLVDVDAGPDGTTTVAWISRRRGGEARVRTRTFESGEWTLTTTLPGVEPDDEAREVAVTAGPGGAAYMTWTEIHSFCCDSQAYARRRPDGTWTKSATVPGRAGWGLPQAAFASDGRAMMMWGRQNRTQRFSELMAMVRRNGKWSTPRQLLRPRGERGEFVVAGGAHGRFRVVWQYQRPPSSHGDTYALETRYRGTQGRWSDAVTLSTRNQVYGFPPALALGPGWSAAAMWKQRDPDTSFGRNFYAGLPTS